MPVAALSGLAVGNAGAGGPLGRSLLAALQVEAVCHGCDAGGTFLHEPEPTEANLRDLCPMVRQAKAEPTKARARGIAPKPCSKAVRYWSGTGSVDWPSQARLPKRYWV